MNLSLYGVLIASICLISQANVIQDYTELNLEEIYRCSLDVNDCSTVMNIIGSPETLRIVESELFLVPVYYRITDVSSIIKPTVGNQICIIPFEWERKEYSHCLPMRKPYQCMTDIGLRDCAKGKFLIGTAGESSDTFTNEFKFPTQLVESFGKYIIRFYILMKCDSEQDVCNDQLASQDFISIRIQNGLNSVKSKNYSYNTIEKDNVWLQKSIELIATYSKLDITIVFGRPVKIKLGMVYGFDNIQIFSVKNLPNTTTTSNSMSPTITSTKTTTNYIPVNKLIYFCDFDMFDEDNQCNGTLNIPNTNVLFDVQKNIFISSTQYFLTDVTSITKPTVDTNEYCIFPFEYKNRTYNYCSLDKDSYKCSVSEVSNVLGKCQLGQFLVTRASNQQVFEVSFSVNFDFMERGIYEVGHYIFLYSPLITNYQSNEDYILLSIDGQDDSEKILDNIELDESSNQNKWNKKTVKFELKDPQNITLNVKFGRKYVSNIYTYFAVDNLQLTYLGMAPTTPTTTASTSDPNDKTSDSFSTSSTAKIPTKQPTQPGSIIQTIVSNSATNALLGIFLPLILLALILLIVIYWKRSTEILNKLDKQEKSQTNEMNVKFSRGNDHLSFKADDETAILNNFEDD